jgi:heme/copper-type cytochrome/quinol oxidase subunit 3
MSLRVYTCLFFSLLGCTLAALGITFAIALLSSQPRNEEKRILTTLALAAAGCAFSVNTACGFQHKTMRAKGGTMTFEKSGKSFYLAFIPMNIGLALLAFGAAFRTWLGIVPINL